MPPQPDPALRCCPICATVSTEAVCRKHGKNLSVPTFTYGQLVHRLRRYEGGSTLLRRAIDAILIAQNEAKVRGNP